MPSGPGRGGCGPNRRDRRRRRGTRTRGGPVRRNEEPHHRQREPSASSAAILRHVDVRRDELDAIPTTGPSARSSAAFAPVGLGIRSSGAPTSTVTIWGTPGRWMECVEGGHDGGEGPQAGRWASMRLRSEARSRSSVAAIPSATPWVVCGPSTARPGRTRPRRPVARPFGRERSWQHARRVRGVRRGQYVMGDTWVYDGKGWKQVRRGTQGLGRTPATARPWRPSPTARRCYSGDNAMKFSATRGPSMKELEKVQAPGPSPRYAAAMASLGRRSFSSVAATRAECSAIRGCSTGTGGRRVPGRWGRWRGTEAYGADPTRRARSSPCRGPARTRQTSPIRWCEGSIRHPHSRWRAHDVDAARRQSHGGECAAAFTGGRATRPGATLGRECARRASWRWRCSRGARVGVGDRALACVCIPRLYEVVSPHLEATSVPRNARVLALLGAGLVPGTLVLRARRGRPIPCSVRRAPRGSVDLVELTPSEALDLATEYEVGVDGQGSVLPWPSSEPSRPVARWTPPRWCSAVARAAHASFGQPGSSCSSSSPSVTIEGVSASDGEVPTPRVSGSPRTDRLR